MVKEIPAYMINRNKSGLGNYFDCQAKIEDLLDEVEAGKKINMDVARLLHEDTRVAISLLSIYAIDHAIGGDFPDEVDFMWARTMHSMKTALSYLKKSPDFRKMKVYANHIENRIKIYTSGFPLQEAA